MYLQRYTQFLLNNEITYTMPFYLQHSRSLATQWPSSYLWGWGWGVFFFLRLKRKKAPACIPLTYAKITIVNNHSKRRGKKNIYIYIKGAKIISLRVCALQVLYEDYYEDPSGNSLRWQRLSDENYHSYEINTCLPPRLKPADNVYCRDNYFTF